MISDEKLDAVVTAAERVAEINENYRRQMAASPPLEEERIVEEAKAALVKAVTDQGLSVDEYNEIIDAAQNDPAVQGRIIERMRPEE
jgi:hypothetical protein